jgi:hypothetical protein
MSWKGESRRHSLASRGIKTREIPPPREPISNDYYAVVHKDNEDPYDYYVDKHIAERMKKPNQKIIPTDGPRVLFDVEGEDGGIAHVLAIDENEALYLFLESISDYSNIIDITSISLDSPNSNVYEIIYDFK